MEIHRAERRRKDHRLGGYAQRRTRGDWQQSAAAALRHAERHQGGAQCGARKRTDRVRPAERIAPRKVGCSKFKYKSDTKSARIQLVKLLIFNTLYCQIVL